MKNERIAATCSPVACSYYLICWLGPWGSQREKRYPSTPLLVSSPNVRSIGDLRFPVKLELHRGRGTRWPQFRRPLFYAGILLRITNCETALSFAKSGKHRRIRAINRFAARYCYKLRTSVRILGCPHKIICR